MAVPSTPNYARLFLTIFCFLAACIFCTMWAVTNEELKTVLKKPAPTCPIKVEEYKQIATSLDNCNQRLADEAEDTHQMGKYTWDRIMMLDRYIPDAPDDDDRVRANDICERCEYEAEGLLWDYKDEVDEFCWCPFDAEYYP